MDFALIRKDARDRLKGNWGTAVLTVLVYTLISTAVEGVGFFSDTIFGLLGSILFLVVYGPLQYGMTSVFLKIHRGQKTEMSDLFTGFNGDVGNKMSAGISIYIYTFLWSLLLIVPGIVASYSYSMTYFLMLDNPKLKADEAIKQSKKMMDGHKMELFCLDLSFIGWIILGILTCGVGMLWVSSYMNAAHARFYEAISGKVGVQEPETEESGESEIKSQDEVKPYTESGDATVIYRLKCKTCGATETHTEKKDSCPYCGGEMEEV